VVGNVFLHTPVGSPFAVRVDTGPGAVRITVADAGGGIADPEQALRRGESGVGSTGLGLDIARRLAEGTGGRVRIGRSTLGGAEVEILLRREPDPAAGRSRRRLRRGRRRDV